MESLYEIGKRLNNDKITQHGYHRFYPLFLEQFRDKPIKFLEIGVHTPAPFDIWREYLPLAKLYGIDIQEIEKDKWPYDSRVFCGDQNDPKFLDEVIYQIDDKVEIIIDDGSHVPSHQLSAFIHLFYDLLRDGGIYIIEDIETNYWTHGELYGNKIQCGWRNPKSVIEFFKHIIDFDINSEFFGYQYLNDNFDDAESILNKIQKFYNEIETVTFAQNCIIIIKKDKKYQEYYDRPYRFASYIV